MLLFIAVFASYTVMVYTVGYRACSRRYKKNSFKLEVDDTKLLEFFDTYTSKYPSLQSILRRREEEEN